MPDMASVVPAAQLMTGRTLESAIIVRLFGSMLGGYGACGAGGGIEHEHQYDTSYPVPEHVMLSP